MSRRALLLAIGVLVACGPRPHAAARPDRGRAIEPPSDTLALTRLTGPWRWFHAEHVDGTLRVERERWRWDAETLDPASGVREVRGQYRRDVLVVALDGESFLCNQLTSYLQTATFQVRARRDDDGLIVEELGYQAAPSPCEPGFRKLASYRVELVGAAATLRWEGGAQTLSRLPAGAYDDAELALPVPATGAARFAGAWHWRVVGRGGDLEVREEDEGWQLAIGEDGRAGGTYRREVTVRRPDGAEIPCARATSYSYVDLYTLRGTLDGDTLSVEEVAVEPAQHPCLSTTTTRHLDAFTATASGDHLVLTWRGPRRQVLHRH